MASNPPSTSPPLKILCIHGYRQNGQTFREKTGSFRKIIKKQAELVFITAPNEVPPIENENEEKTESNSEQRGWWFSREDNYFKAQDPSDCIKGYAESLALIEETFKTQGPFDGVLGFSQGATMVSLICGLREQNKDSIFQFKFVILVAGFKSRSRQHDHLYNVPLTMPSLHVFGETDKVIQKEMSEDLLQHFSEPKVLQHSGGHFIPTSSPQKTVYLEFLNEMIKLKQ